MAGTQWGARRREKFDECGPRRMWFRRKGVCGPAQGRLWFRRKGVCGPGSGARASVDRAHVGVTPPLVPAQGRLWAGARASVVPAQGRLWTGFRHKGVCGPGACRRHPPGACRRRPPGASRRHPPRRMSGSPPGACAPGEGGGRFRAKCMSTGHGGAGGGCSQVWAIPFAPTPRAGPRITRCRGKDGAPRTEGGGLKPPPGCGP